MRALGLSSGLSAFLLVVCCAAAAQQPHAAVLSGHVPRWAQQQSDSGPLPPETPLPGLRLYLKRTPQRERALQQRMADQLDPGSPYFHRWLTPEALAAEFGPSQQDVEAARQWLSSSGFAVDGTARSGLWIAFRGTAGQVNRAFATEIHRYISPTGANTRFAPETPPLLPPELAANVLAVRGLSTHTAHPGGHAQPSATFCYSSTDCLQFIAPQDFATIYDIPSGAGTGAGETVVIVGRSRVYSDDVSEFESTTGLPANTPTTIIPPGGADPGTPANGTNGDSTDDQLEATLDVSRVIGTAPGSTVDLVVSADTPMEDGLDIAMEYAVDNATTLHATALSNSFGLCEQDVTQSDVAAINSLYQQAAAQGVSVIGISGDSGAAGCDPYNSTPPAEQIRSANYLCSSSYVTCMGGTEFNDSSNPSKYWSSNNSSGLGSALSYIPEGAWNEPTLDGDYQASATGGGVSVYEPTPSWQTGTGVPGTAGRYTPDAAFSSSDHDGYYACYAAGGGNCGQGYFEYFYGTSAAAPSMAGVVALLAGSQGSSLGNLNPVLYSIAAQPGLGVFHDTTIASSGVSNCSATTPSMCNNSTPSPASLSGGLAGYTLATGYDLATGWGSFDVGKLIARWSSAAPSATTAKLSFSPGTTLIHGANITATVTITAANSTTPSSGSVTIYGDGQALVTLPVSNGKASVTTGTGGYAPGTYSVTAVYSGSASYKGSNSPAVNVTLENSTTTKLAVSSTSVTPPGSDTLTATVTSPNGTPSGTVKFYADGSVEIGSATLSKGVARLTASTNGIPAATYSVTAVYTANGSFGSSTSNAVNVTVK